MTIERSETVERLRPAGLRSRPVYMPQVFDAPDHVLALVRERAPYRSMLAYYNHGRPGDPLESPWFIDMPGADFLVQNPRWIAAAKEAFSARLVEPLHCTINVYGPAEASSPHMDLPVFRGMAAPEVPVWLLMSMSNSGLFLPWLVPVASGLAWFYRGEGGEFEYWPQGPTHPSSRVSPPMWNVGVMSDNEVMWHRVGQVGSAAEIASLAGRLKTSAMMHCREDQWEVRQDGEALCTIPDDRLRISLLWKAYVFTDADHQASFRNRAYDLDAGHVAEIFLADLRQRGIGCTPPADPLHDEAWRNLLLATYASPFRQRREEPVQ